MDRDDRYLKQRTGTETNYIVASHDSGCDTMRLQFTINLKYVPNTYVVNICVIPLKCGHPYNQDTNIAIRTHFLFKSGVRIVGVPCTDMENGNQIIYYIIKQGNITCET